MDTLNILCQNPYSHGAQFKIPRYFLVVPACMQIAEAILECPSFPESCQASVGGGIVRKESRESGVNICPKNLS